MGIVVCDVGNDVWFCQYLYRIPTEQTQQWEENPIHQHPDQECVSDQHLPYPDGYVPPVTFAHFSFPTCVTDVAPTYGLTFADIEKLVQVYGKWETARPKIGSKSSTVTRSTTTKVGSKAKNATKASKAPTHTTATNADPDDATDTTTIQSDELSNTTDKVSSNVSPTIRITARLKKQWKQLLQQQDDVVVACCT